MRTSKTVGGVKHNYYYVEGKLMYEDCPSYKLFYAYDANGFLSGIKRIKSNGTTENYGVHCNIFGDVISIYYDDGMLAATYTYDSWGKLLAVTDMVGCDIMGDNDIWTQNSIRYRGYVYDEETKLYYLQSRYYDPETCRFINADDYSVLTASPTALSDKNLFTYCDCNPIIRADDEGDVWHIVAGAAIGGTLELASQLLSGKSFNDINWTKLCIATVAGGVTAATGSALIAAAISVFSNAAMAAVDKKDGKQIAGAFISGSASSLIGSGVGKMVSNIGGKIAINKLSKMPKAQVKATILKVNTAIKGAERNKIKNMSYLKSNYDYKSIGKSLFGTTKPFIADQSASIISGFGIDALISRYWK